MLDASSTKFDASNFVKHDLLTLLSIARGEYGKEYGIWKGNREGNMSVVASVTRRRRLL